MVEVLIRHLPVGNSGEPLLGVRITGAPADI
jgi:hypothetical protein